MHIAKWYELHGIVDTRDTRAVSLYFVLLRYTAVYRDLRDNQLADTSTRWQDNSLTNQPTDMTSRWQTKSLALGIAIVFHRTSFLANNVSTTIARYSVEWPVNLLSASRFVSELL